MRQEYHQLKQNYVEMVISEKDINMGTNRQIIYIFVLNQVKHKLIKKTRRFVYNCTTVLLRYVFNPSIIL